MVYDVAVIGAGVIGALTARELTRYSLNVCIIEKESDAACGASGANTGIIHAGYDPEPGTLKAELGVKGAAAFEQLAGELGIPFKRIGSLLLAFKNDDMPLLQELYDKGVQNGVRSMRIITQTALRRIEPAVSKEAKAALYAPTAALTCPFEYNFAALENAVANGAVFCRNHRVVSIQDNTGSEDGVFEIKCSTSDRYTANKTIRARYMVNAAGANSDAVSAMAGYDGFRIRPVRGQYVLLDKSQGDGISHAIFPIPTKVGKGILVTPTVHGNLLIGPSAEQIAFKDDTSTTADGMDHVMERAAASMPRIDFKAVISSFSGIRASVQGSGRDFIIGPIPGCARFVNAAGIDSPGLTAAPAIAAMVIGYLKDAGLGLTAKKEFDPIRKAMPRFAEMGKDELTQAFTDDCSYGRLVCRCEKVSEAEIVNAIRRPGGAVTLDGIKLRTRAGMGRCQGSFCTPAVMEIAAREWGIPVKKVTKSGKGSELIIGKLK